eukprot:3565144-Heterocapsa_arctica.AAC.1
MGQRRSAKCCWRTCFWAWVFLPVSRPSWHAHPPAKRLNFSIALSMRSTSCQNAWNMLLLIAVVISCGSNVGWPATSFALYCPPSNNLS